MSSLTIRDAVQGDVATIWGLARELAVFEKLDDQFVATVEDYTNALFGPDSVAKVAIAEIDGEVAGMALYISTFSTFLGRTGIWLEDLFVRDVFRRRGVARSLLEELHLRSPGRLEWEVLDWNDDAIALYDSVGASRFTGWVKYRMASDA